MIIFFIFSLMMNKTTLAFGLHDFFWPLVVRGVALSMLFVPITTLAVQDLHGPEIGQGTGLNTMMRQLGGSLGIALITTFVDQRFMFHSTILRANLNAYNDAFVQRFNGLLHGFMSKGFGEGKAREMAYAAVDGITRQQSMLLSYTDVFWIVGIFFLCIIPLIAFQKYKAGGSNAAAAAH
jgi:DHA2 family multidrug resistance protein